MDLITHQYASVGAAARRVLPEARLMLQQATARRLDWLEALTNFIDGEPLWKVHQSVFAVLALESEPVDPRL